MRTTLAAAIWNSFGGTSTWRLTFLRKHMSHNNGIISKPIEVINDVAFVLGESTGHIGELCTSEKINEWSENKPYRHSDINTNLSNRQSAMYGWDILVKQPGESTSAFLSKIDTYYKNGGEKCWDYLRPRGLSYGEYCRLLDFDGYDHNAVAYRTPVTYSRVGLSHLPLETDGKILTLAGGTASQQVVSHSTQIHYDGSAGYSIEFSADLTNPSNATSGATLSVYGTVQLQWSPISGTENWQNLSGSYVTWGTSNTSVKGSFSGAFPGTWGKDSYYKIRLAFFLTNRTQVSGQYVQQQITVKVPLAGVYVKKDTGTDGIFISPATYKGGLSTDALNSIFGTVSNLSPIVAIKLEQSGKAAQYELANVSEAAGYGGFILFDELYTDLTPTSVTTYLFYGNVVEIFGSNYDSATGKAFGAISLADKSRLVVAPYCKHIYF